MRRSSRIFLKWLNPGKTQTLCSFFMLGRTVIQSAIDYFWSTQNFTSDLADKETTDRLVEKFAITARLSQCLAKQAKETVRGEIEAAKEARQKPTKPNFHSVTITLDQRFVSIENFDGSFDFALKLLGSGAPKMVIPLKSTSHLNTKLRDGWTIGKTVRLGIRKQGIFIDLILEKPRPPLRTNGEVVGIDSNYKAGITTSRDEFIGKEVYEKIQSFGKSRKHTFSAVKNMVFHALKSLNLTGVKTLVVENLKKVRHGTKGKFPRVLNRRMSHWLYSAIMDWLQQHCEELGIRFSRKDSWKTSQCCSQCHRWDRRSRKGDEFHCVFCGHTEHADLNAPKNLVFLELAGVYSLRLLQNQTS